MITSGGIASEYLKLEYYDEATLYVPVTSLHKISRYMGSEHVVLSRLGSDKWNQSKRKAAEKIRMISPQNCLLSMPKAKQRLAMLVPSMKRFTNNFPVSFHLKKPQIKKSLLMLYLPICAHRVVWIRLVCGDVGFGKTEVGMRAAFIAVQAKRQVAFLVPTTLLAQQHYESFRDRFANWPVQIRITQSFPYR